LPIIPTVLDGNTCPQSSEAIRGRLLPRSRPRESSTWQLRWVLRVFDDDDARSGGAEKASGFQSAAVRRIPDLIEGRRVSPDLPLFRERAAALRHAATATLVARLETTADDLLLWAAHLELDGRNVPPALRWPGREHDEQALYVTWTADLFWFCRRNPTHRAQFRSWQGLFKHPPGSAAWHATAHRNFMFVQPRYSLAHWCSKGLGLTADDRALLMTLPTNQMRADRRTLDPRQFTEIQRRLLDAAMQKPDRAMRHAAHEVAGRRAAMWRTHILCCRNYTLGAQAWARHTGETITRQAFTKQVHAAASVIDHRGPA
jgi:hypothetical protein